MPAEPLLCEEFGVSRTVVREAVSRWPPRACWWRAQGRHARAAGRQLELVDPDVVAWQTHAGLTRDFLRDLQELRRVIEPAAVRMAAERATAQDIAEIEAAYAGMKQAVEHGGDYVASDLRFHQGLLRAGGNRMMVQMSKAIGALLRTSFEVSTTLLDGPASSLPLHRAVLDAVIAHKPEQAERASLKLIDSARRRHRTRAGLGPQAAVAAPGRGDHGRRGPAAGALSARAATSQQGLDPRARYGLVLAFLRPRWELS